MITILVIAPYQTFADSFAEVSAAWPETSGGMDGYEITTRVIFEYEHAVISAMRPEYPGRRVYFLATSALSQHIVGCVLIVLCLGYQTMNAKNRNASKTA